MNQAAIDSNFRCYARSLPGPAPDNPPTYMQDSVRRALFVDEAGATHLFSALDGRVLRLSDIAGPPAAALWDEDDCNCAVLVCGVSLSTPGANGSGASPAAGAVCSAHTVVYTPHSLDGPSELPCGLYALHGCVHVCDGLSGPFMHAGSLWLNLCQVCITQQWSVAPV